MRQIFADTWYWIAVANPLDPWAPIVERLAPELEDLRIVTTDEVLVELLAHFSGSGATSRERASAIARALLSSTRIELVPQTREGLLRGLGLYERRRDKGYSLTDCISMEIMREREIAEVLTGDRHFAQEGFVPLLPPR